MGKDSYEYFMEHVWPEIREKRGLPETALPTNEDIADYLSSLVDAADVWGAA